MGKVHKQWGCIASIHGHTRGRGVKFYVFACIYLVTDPKAMQFVLVSVMKE